MLYFDSTVPICIICRQPFTAGGEPMMLRLSNGSFVSGPGVCAECHTKDTLPMREMDAGVIDFDPKKDRRRP
jgi:hypothetical protein